MGSSELIFSSSAYDSVWSCMCTIIFRKKVMFQYSGYPKAGCRNFLTTCGVIRQKTRVTNVNFASRNRPH